MALAHDFQFSQSSLQDFLDCKRRFQLRYLLKVAWPAQTQQIENERAMQQGAQFHRLIQQHLLGIPAARLDSFVAAAESISAEAGQFGQWWQNYLQFAANLPLEDGAAAFYPEAVLSAPLNAATTPPQPYRLLAKYDLLLILPTQSAEKRRAVIYDWKTSQKPSTRQRLLERMQTRLYLYLLARAGGRFLTPPRQEAQIPPEQIEMIYWFAGEPQAPEHIPYSRAQYARDETEMRRLITEIVQLSEAENANQAALSGQAVFPLTTDARRCQFCTYRSLCGRPGAENEQGDAQDDEESSAFASASEFDFEQIAEIAF